LSKLNKQLLDQTAVQRSQSKQDKVMTTFMSSGPNDYWICK
jgi:hypothetical protein